MQWKMLGLAICVLLLTSACSGSSQVELGVTDSGKNFALSVPSAIAMAREIPLEEIYATLEVSEQDIQILEPENLEMSFKADYGVMLQIDVSWYQRIEGKTDLLLARRSFEHVVNGNEQINVDNYVTSSEDRTFDFDGDGISNLAELAANTDPYDANSPSSEPTTAFRIIADSPDHQIFEDLLITHELSDRLDNLEQPHTIFAPTDSAFTDLVNERLNEMTFAQIRRMLKHHAIAGSYQSGAINAQLTSPNAELRLNTLASEAPMQSLVFTSSETGLRITDGSGNTSSLDNTLNLNAPIEGVSQPAIVHVIDTVLSPAPVDNVQPLPPSVTPDVIVKRIDASDAPVIDGSYDLSRIWDSATFRDTAGTRLLTNNLMLDQGALRADGFTFDDRNLEELYWFAMHDDRNLYVMVAGELVNKASLFRDSDDVWNDDSVNLFIDGNNSKGSSYDGVDDRHILVPLLTSPGNPSSNSTVAVRGISSAPLPAFEFYSCRCGNGVHVWEFKLPLAEFNITKGVPFGIDVQIDLDHDGGERDVRWGWFHPSRTTQDVDNTFLNPSYMGTAILQ